MKIRITYYVWKVPFIYETESVSDAWDAVKAIIQREKLMFPDQESAFCNYFKILSDIAFGSSISHEMFIFKIEKVLDGAS
jgi:hypothetical protein